MDYKETQKYLDAGGSYDGSYHNTLAHKDRGELLDMLAAVRKFAEEQGAYLTAEGILAILEDKT